MSSQAHKSVQDSFGASQTHGNHVIPRPPVVVTRTEVPGGRFLYDKLQGHKPGGALNASSEAGYTGDGGASTMEQDLRKQAHFTGMPQ